MCIRDRVGVSAIGFYLFFILVPVWEGPVPKADKRWDTILFVASTLLPISVLVGITLVSIGMRFTSFRLRHRGILFCCVVLWSMISNIRPGVSRIRRPGTPNPLYETVPDTMGVIVCVLFVIVSFSALFNRLSKSKTDSGGITMR